MLTLAGWYLLALAVSLALVPACRAFAVRFGYVAKPKEDRWHRKQTALLGGVAIAVTVLGLAALLRPVAEVAVLMAAGGLIALFGLVDDLISLKPYSKLVAQIAVASGLLLFGYRLHWVESLTLDTMLTLVWLVGMTNAFNLLDNMDGLCAGIGLIVSATLLAGFVAVGELGPHAGYLAILMGALSGFLVYNFNPASIFMGDSGSLFIGLTLAAIALEPGTGPRAGSSVLAIIGAPLLVLLIPIFDTTFVTISRLLSGRSPARGGRDHSSHRLVAMGLSERAAVRVLWTLAAAGGLIGLALRGVASGLAVPLALAFVLAMVIFAVYLARVRVYEDVDASLVLAGKVTPVVANFMYKRRVAEVLLDLCLVPLCYYAAYRVRFEGPEYQLFFQSFMESLPLVVGLQITALFAVGGYRGVWRHFGLMDGVVFAKGVALGTIAIVVAVLYLYRFEQYSRGVFVIYAALLMLALAGSRASFRLMSEFIKRRASGQRLVIYGAGDGGSIALPELLKHPDDRYRMIGYVDDDPAKLRMRLQGYLVIGAYDELRHLVTSGGVDSVVLSTGKLDRARVAELEALCASHGISLLQLHFRFEHLVET